MTAEPSTELSELELERERLRAAIKEELCSAVETWDASRARSQQTDMGASGFGHPCDRHLFHAAAGTPKGDRGETWYATVGTAIHEYVLEPALRDHVPASNYEVGVKLQIAHGIKGTGDALRHDVQPNDDGSGVVVLDNDVVIDHKIMGTEPLRNLRLRGVKQQYRAQIHGYGHGYILRGANVKWVGIAGWPRNNTPRNPTYGLYIHLEPYDEEVVEQALQRWYRIQEAVPTLTAQPDLIPLALATADGPCAWCPYRDPAKAAIDPRTACAGDPSLQEDAVKRATAGLIA